MFNLKSNVLRKILLFQHFIASGAAVDTPPAKSASKKSRKTRDSEKKDKKDEKKNKKRGFSFAITCCVASHGIKSCSDPGTSSSSNGNVQDSDSESLDEILNEAQALLGLRAKDLNRSASLAKMEDLTARQLAYVMCGSCSVFTAADLYDLGGEMET